jgi:serine phosphatase RsbU (regulator of sigma subunit)
MIDEEPALVDMIARVNRLLHEDLPSGRFVTFALIDIDSASHEGIFLSAGHGPTMWMKGSDGSASSIDAQGLPLGIVPDQEWDEVYRVPFEPGDIVIIFSDGFFEAQDPGDELFGLDRLQEVVRTSRQESAEVILQRMDEAVTAWAQGRPQQDDMTAIVIKRVAR